MCFLLLVISFVIFSCQKKYEKVEEKKLKVVTSSFPLYDFAKTIGGQKAEVTLLLPPGVEAHSFEPKPGDILKIHEADIFIYTGRFMEPWVEDILKGIGSQKLLIVDSSKGVALVEGKDHHKPGVDPHIWLDFSNAEKMVNNILDGVIRKDPVNREFYQKNAEEYKAKLSELDKRFKDLLATCKKNVFVHGGHFAFGYLAKRYHLKYLSAYRGFSPDAEPTPKSMVELSKKLKEHGLTYVYYEELITPKVAEAIARETGAKLLMLHGAHNITREDMERGATFLSLMERNMENLKIGLQCQ
jgi:zinc transport system substrate-binding protein